MSDDIFDVKYRLEFAGGLFRKASKYPASDEKGFVDNLLNVFWEIGRHYYLSKEKPGDSIDQNERDELKIKCSSGDKKLENKIKQEALDVLSDRSLMNFFCGERKNFFEKAIDNFKK